MRTHGFRSFAIVSMLALLFGSQWCMIAECGAKPVRGATASAAHACCAKNAAARTAKHAPAPHDCSKPCCMSATTSPTPELARPALLGPSEIEATLATYEMAPLAVSRWPLGSHDPYHRHASPPRLAAGLRAPPC